MVARFASTRLRIEAQVVEASAAVASVAVVATTKRVVTAEVTTVVDTAAAEEDTVSYKPCRAHLKLLTSQSRRWRLRRSQSR